MAVAATFVAEYGNIADPNAFPVDSTIHVFWMRRFQDAGLLQDPLTLALIDTGLVPPGTMLLYRVASLFVDPVAFSEWLPLVLVPLSVWMVFRITRLISDQPFAAWFAALTFLFAWEIHRFTGGHARAFAIPVILGTVLLLMRGRESRAVALVPAAGVLLYPPAGLSALAVLGWSAVRWSGGPRLDLRRLLVVGASGVLVTVALLIPRWTADPGPEPLTRAEAQRLPEYGEDGQVRFFASSPKDFLKQNYSGLDLRVTGSMLLITALVLLAARPRNARLLPREVWALPAAALSMFALAHLLLFQLYLPHRYTYPLLPFLCIAIAVMWLPSWQAAVRRIRGRRWLLAGAVLLTAGLLPVASMLFPLGPEWNLHRFLLRVRPVLPILVGAGTLGLTVALLALRRRGIPLWSAMTAAAVGAVLLTSQVAAIGELRVTPRRCGDHALLAYLGTLPRDAIVAGDPNELKCVPIAARRPVVISKKLYQPLDLRYLPVIRPRMYAMVNAYYGQSVDAIVDLRDRFGADYLVVRESLLLRKDLPRAWKRLQPFTDRVSWLKSRDGTPAALRLPYTCRTWADRKDAVYDLGCVSTSNGATSALG